MSTDTTEWIKAAASGGSGNCVELRRCGQGVEVRDSKDQGEGPILGMTTAAATAWLDGAKQGEFDHLIT